MANFLEGVHKSVSAMERVKSLRCLRAARVGDRDPAVEEAVDYEALVAELEGDLEVVHRYHSSS